jgi:hypothetical protein
MAFKNYYMSVIYRIKDLMKDNNPRKEIIKLRNRLRLNYTEVISLFSQRMKKKVKELNPKILKAKEKLIKRIEKIHNINGKNRISNDSAQRTSNQN